MEIDIRKEVIEGVDVIRIADHNLNEYIVEYIKNTGRNIAFCDSSDANRKCLEVSNKEHALNIIKALEKAIELGWLK